MGLFLTPFLILFNSFLNEFSINFSLNEFASKILLLIFFTFCAIFLVFIYLISEYNIQSFGSYPEENYEDIVRIKFLSKKFLLIIGSLVIIWFLIILSQLNFNLENISWEIGYILFFPILIFILMFFLKKRLMK